MAAELKDAGAPRTEPEPRALPAYFHRLSVRAQRIYLASDALDHFELAAGRNALELAAALLRALDSGAPTVLERSAQALVDDLCGLIGRSGLRLEVRSVRPHDARGELHGIFYPRGTGKRAADRHGDSRASAGTPLIVLWMRTAQRHDVVKPKTFFRTLMHEFAHYLDYALLKLGDSPHTAGFFKRESSLMRMLWPGAAQD